MTFYSIQEFLGVLLHPFCSISFALKYVYQPTLWNNPFYHPSNNWLVKKHKIDQPFKDRLISLSFLLCNERIYQSQINDISKLLEVTLEIYVPIIFLYQDIVVISLTPYVKISHLFDKNCQVYGSFYLLSATWKICHTWPVRNITK